MVIGDCIDYTIYHHWGNDPFSAMKFEIHQELDDYVAEMNDVTLTFVLLG